MAIEIIVHPGVDSAFIAWRAPFIDQCRGFALKRKVKRAPGSAVSPNTTGETDARGFVEGSSQVGSALRTVLMWTPVPASPRRSGRSRNTCGRISSVNPQQLKSPIASRRWSVLQML